MRSDIEIRQLLSTDNRLASLTDRIRTGLRLEMTPTIAVSLDIWEAREVLDHGLFLAYCMHVINVKPRCAQNRLNVARLTRGFGADQVALLQIGIAQVLGAKSAPKDIVEAIMIEFAQGAQLSLAEVKARLGRKSRPSEKTRDMDEAERIADILRQQLDEEGREAVTAFLSGGSVKAIRHAAALLTSPPVARPACARDNAMFV